MGKRVPPDISVCVVSFNTREETASCLRSLYSQDQGAAFEVIVVDNGSDDGSGDMVASEFPAAKLIVNGENRFFTRANNQAICASSAPLLLILNADTVVPPGTLGAIREFFAAHPRAGAVGCGLKNSSGELTPNGWPSRTPGDLLRSNWLVHMLGLGRAARGGAASPDAAGDPRRAEVVSDACMAVRRSALADVGPYDEQFKLYFTEDDVCRRLAAAGWEVWYAPQIAVSHVHYASTRRLDPRHFWRIQFADTSRYVRKYSQPTLAAPVNALLWLDFAAKLAACTLNPVWGRPRLRE